MLDNKSLLLKFIKARKPDFMIPSDIVTLALLIVYNGSPWIGGISACQLIGLKDIKALDRRIKTLRVGGYIKPSETHPRSWTVIEEKIEEMATYE